MLRKFRKTMVSLLLLPMMLVAGCSSTQKEAQTLNLFVAAGMKKPMDIVIEKYTEETNNEVVVNYGPSGGLFSQIKEGQPCDLYFNADWMYTEKVEEAGLLEEGVKYLNDNLVLCVSESAKEKITSLDDLKKDGISIAICDPKAPVGQYAEDALKKLGLWEDAEKNIVARPSTVNQAGIMVTEDQVDATIIFSSVAKSIDLESIETISKEDSGEIIFSIAAIKDGNSEVSKEFIEFAQKNIGEFEKFGWTKYE